MWTEETRRRVEADIKEMKEAVEEEKRKIAMMGFVAKEVVAALGPTCIPMLQEEIANIYYTFKHNMSDISYYL